MQAQIRVYDGLEKLAQARVSQGLDNAYERSNTQLKRSALVTQQLLNEQNITLTQMQLGLLAGGGAERGFLLHRPQLSALADPELPAQLSARLLGRRPDIVAARLRVEALQAKAEFTKASFYPDINLTGLAGLVTTDVSSLFSNRALIASVAPAISLPIFERGRIRARLRADYAEMDMAVIAYNQTVNQAFADVIQQLTAVSTTESMIEQQTEAVVVATHITDIATTRHDRGIGPAKATLQAKLALINDRQLLLALRSQRRIQQVEMVRALGGGFDASEYAASHNSATSFTAKPTP